jgi:DNA primase
MSVIDEIKDRLDITEVIQPYVPLQKAGRNYKGLCPFHAEKTPSFVVFPDTGTWHCFGACGTGGDVFSFIMQQENVGFGEALRILAQRAGIELEPQSPEMAETEKRLELLREINLAAATYFHHLLLNADEAGRTRAYLEQRGINRDTIEHFRLGYALDQWDGLLRYLESKSYAIDDIQEAGLIIERKDGSGFYDRFRKRLIVPIRDHRGRTIGFGGRVLDDSLPKYLNSPQSPLFDKSSVLYGLDLAKQGIRTMGYAVIVEGYMDVLMAHQFGINNVVAQMGTALTEAQLQRLKKHTQRFVLALDSDTAGDRATLRGLDVARQVMDHEVVPVPTPRGLIRFEDRLAADIRIVSLPEGQDPDEVIRNDPSAWAQLIAQAKPVMDYYLDVLTVDLDLATGPGKAQAVRDLGPLIAEIGDRVQRTHYLQKLSRMVQTDERTLWQQIRQVTGSRPAPRRRRPEPERDDTPGLPPDLGEHCLSFALYYPDLLQSADLALKECNENPLRPDDLARPEDRAILGSWREWLGSGGSSDARAEFYDTLDRHLQDRVDTLLNLQSKQPPAPDDLLRDQVLDAIARLRLRNLRRRNREIQFLQTDAEASSDRQLAREYMELGVKLTLRIKQLEIAISSRSLSGRRRQLDAAVRVPFSEE